MITRIRAVIMLVFVIFRGSLLIIENEQEVNVPLTWASTLATLVVTGLMLYYNA